MALKDTPARTNHENDEEVVVPLVNKSASKGGLDMENLQRRTGASKTVIAGACFCAASGGMVS